MSKFVVRGACVITMNPDVGTLPAADVLVEDGTIREVGEHLQTGEDVEVIDGTDRILMPGFVDSHRHLWQTAFRGELASCSLGSYFQRIMIGLAPSVTPDEVYAGTLLGAYQLLDAGITSVVDWANVINSPEHADAGIKALTEVGIRGVYAYGWPGGAEYLFHSTIPHPEDVRRVAGEYFTGSDQLLTLGVGLRGPVSNPPEVLKADWYLGRDVGARLNVHTGMRVPGVNTSDITILDECGLLGPDTTYVHCTNTTDAEFARIADTGGHVSISAYCEMVMGHGHPPTSRVVDAGLKPSLSADIVATVPGDMFSHMRATLTDARISTYPDDPSVPFDPAITHNDVLRYATTNGAEALGLADRLGSIAVGKEADMVLVRTDRLNAIPNVDPVATVVTQIDTGNIDTVWVRGRAVKRDGELIDVDMAKLRRLSEDATAALESRLGS